MKEAPSKKKSASTGKGSSGAQRQPPPAAARTDGIRETIESVVIAFVLAFLFRTFEAEAFVIPTGSMAPTLKGRHKEVTCEACGYSFQVSASDEVDADTNKETGKMVRYATCPLCRYTMPLEGNREDGVARDFTSYKGDRILVGKFPYDFHNPERWDVIVFKYPEQAQTNFIKRLAGLPNETLIIRHGDLFSQPAGAQTEHIARKPPERVRAMLQPVYDNDFLLDDWIKAGWSPRWRPAADVAAEQGGWQSLDGGRGFEATAAGPESSQRAPRAEAGLAGPDDYVWLRYQHIVPTNKDWEDLEARRPFSIRGTRPQLVTDFTAYNTGADRDYSPEALFHQLDANDDHKVTIDEVAEERRERFKRVIGKSDKDGDGAATLDEFRAIVWALTGRPEPDVEVLGLNWVGDLAIECELQSVDGRGEAVLELVEGGRRFQCRFDLSSGAAVLSIEGLANFHPQAHTAVRGAGSHALAFANVDDQLLVWVDDRLVPFDRATTYDNLDTSHPTAADLTPVGVAAGGGAFRVEHLRVLRDVYYVAPEELPPGVQYSPPMSDYPHDPTQFSDLEEPLRRLRNGPEGVPRSSRKLSAAEITAEARRVGLDPAVALELFPDTGPDRLASRLAYLMATPARWGVFDERRERRFVLGPDQFLALGDNSVKSKDGRLWNDKNPNRDGDRPPYCVTRDLLVGKALYIYWPHSFDRLPGTDIWCPLFPNFERMGFVR